MPRVAEVRIDTCRCAPPSSIVRVGWFDEVAPLFLIMSNGAIWVLVTELCLEQIATCRRSFYFTRGPRRMVLLPSRPDRLRLCVCGPDGGHVPLEYRVATEQERGQLEDTGYRMAAKEVGCCRGCAVS